MSENPEVIFETWMEGEFRHGIRIYSDGSCRTKWGADEWELLDKSDSPSARVSERFAELYRENQGLRTEAK